MSTTGFAREELERGEALFSQARSIRFQDVDAAGTVYFARVFEYFGDAYTGLLAHGGVDLPALLASGDTVAPLVHAEADYLSPLRFGDAVRVEIPRTRVGTSSIQIGYRIVTDRGGRLAAIGHTTHVFVDRNTFDKREVPAAFRTAIAPSSEG